MKFRFTSSKRERSGPLQPDGLDAIIRRLDSVRQKIETGRIEDPLNADEDIPGLIHAVQNALRDGAIFQHEVVERSHAGFWSSDRYGITTYTNAVMEAMLGCEHGEMIGRPIYDFVFPEDREDIVAMRMRRRTGVIEQFEYRLRKKDGSAIWVQLSAHPQTGCNGEYEGVIGLATEITSLVLTREKLRETSRALRERVKELRCLQTVSEIIEREHALSEILQEIVDALPTGWQYPEITGARITIGGEEYKTANYRRSEWTLTEPVTAGGVRVGAVEVCYLEARATGDEVPFLKEERELIGLVADKIGHLVERIQARDALHESEIRRGSVLETLIDGAIVIDETGTICEFNPAAEKLFGYGTGDVLGRNVKMLMPQADREMHDRYIDNYLSTGVRKIIGIGREVTGVRKDGTEIPLDLAISEMRLGGRRLFTGIVRDITERKEHESRIAHLNRIHQIISSVNSMIVRAIERQEIFDESCRIMAEHGDFGVVWIDECDPATRKLTPVARAGVDSEQLLPLVRGMLAGRTDGSGLAGYAANILAIHERQAQVSMFEDPRSGEIGDRDSRPADLGYRSWTALPLYVENRIEAVLSLLAKTRGYPDEDEFQLLKDLAANISTGLDRLAKQEQINYLAFYDLLTGFPTRALFLEHVQQALDSLTDSDGISAFVMLGIEQFKRIKDSYGWAVGDALIKSIAHRLREIIGSRYQLGRIAEGNFAILMNNLRHMPDLAISVEEIIDACFSRPFDIDGRELHISIKAGVAVYPQDSADAEVLLMNAEAALTQAVTEARNYMFYAAEMNSRVAESLELEHKLRMALDQQQFVLHYQPRVRSKTGAITGVEALIRWDAGDSELVHPDRFIPILEETGLILPVGEWVMRQAVSDYRVWREAGLPAPRITVNISAVQLRQHDFAGIVKQAINHAGDDDHGLDMEITESVIMTGGEGIVELLEEVRNLGVKIAIDDFGTGYSSLRYITTFPVDMLKIDRSFIANISHDSNDVAVVSSIISLAHQLDLSVVAEGVETEDQAHVLKLLKCDEMQGFLFSKAVPAYEIEHMLRDGTTHLA